MGPFGAKGLINYFNHVNFLSVGHITSSSIFNSKDSRDSKYSKKRTIFHIFADISSDKIFYTYTQIKKKKKKKKKRNMKAEKVYFDCSKPIFCTNIQK